MPFEFSEETINNDLIDFYEDSNDDFVIEHKPSGGTLKYDVSESEWVGFSASGYTDEDAEDAVAALLNAGSNVSLTYDDPNDTLTIDATDTTTDTRTDVSDSGTTVVSETTDINFDSNLDVANDGDGSVKVDASSSTDTTTDVSEKGSTVVSQVTDINFDSNVIVTDDGDGTVTVSATDTDTQLTDEEVEDIVSTLVASDSNLSWTYDDAGDTLTISLSNSISTDSIANDDYNETTQTISSASGTTDLDLSVANTFRVEAIDNVTFTFSNVTSTPAGNSITVYVVESDGAGPYTLSWPTSVVWNGGSAVGEVAQNSNIEISLLTDDGGTEWRGRKSGGGFA